jgi:hypothetical protein
MISLQSNAGCHAEQIILFDEMHDFIDGLEHITEAVHQLNSRPGALVSAGIFCVRDEHDLIHVDVDNLTVQAMQAYPTLCPDLAKGGRSSPCDRAIKEIASQRFLIAEHQSATEQRDDGSWSFRSHDVSLAAPADAQAMH